MWDRLLFSDGGAELELRLPLSGQTVHSSRDLFVDVHESSLTIRVQATGSFTTLMEIANLYGTIKPSETIWYIDEDQLVVNLKKHDSDLKWPDIMENWESLSTGAITLLKGTSVYIVGDSTDINHEVAKELSVGLKYTPLSTSELLETYVQRTIDSWVIREGPDSVAEAESAVLESLSSHVRAVVATLGGKQGAARGHDKWRHLHAGFTVWLSRSQALDEASAKDEALREKQEGSQAYSNADVVVKLGGWEPEHARLAAQACLSALKQLILTDKKLPGSNISFLMNVTLV
ncbi:hypothetical protein AMTR_s00048p00123660 [Amborella trichopoda]|uniref:CS domain-containing protein n=1 Tax=Amborella trichopoda TaxID=13333 RepID=U5D5E1_AMBTC|nr:hypothetical protein AMTR_s00048p00123660 [Amborella trichopoda]